MKDELEIQTTFNEDELDVLIDDGIIENLEVCDNEYKDK